MIISLSHFKGHEQTGFGGAIKNLGMGCGSRRGKMEQHAQGKPMVAPRRCMGCRRCAANAPTAPSPWGEDRKASIDWDKCVGCGRYCGVQHRRHPPWQRRGHGGAGLPHGGVRQGGGGRRPSSTSALSSTCPPTATATGRTTCPSCPTWACSPPFDPVALDRPAPTPCGTAPIPGSPPGRADAQGGLLRQATTSSTACRTPTGSVPGPL